MKFQTLLAAYVLDLLLGDPQWFPHPVRLIGKLIAFLEKKIRRIASSPAGLQAGGVLLALTVCGLTYAVTHLAIRLAGGWSWFTELACSAFIGYLTLAGRDLHLETRKVLRALEKGDLPLARRELSFLVGRDTARLEKKEILRALVETVAENISDGVVAPLFYLGLGGPAWAMTYKAVNTLDSMVGYKNERFRRIGWASAKLDDAANYIPARLCGPVIVLAALLLGLSWRDSWAILKRDRKKHESPNSAWPEAAAAGALGVQLGGLNTYFGEPSQKPLIGEKKKEIDEGDVKRVWAILYVSSAAMLAVAVFLAWAVGDLFWR